MPDFLANTLVVFALEVEAQNRFNDMNLIYCGVGKVNAAHRLTKKISEWRHQHGRLPSLVLNLGSAGSAHFDTGAVVNCTRFVQRDFDVTPLGFAPYATPFEDVPVILQNGKRHAAFPEGICGTGDSFVTDGAMTQWNVVDMEAYALAKICYLENIPFACMKYITDGADGHAARSWEESVAAAAEALRLSVDSLVAAP